ncbi:MAG: gluconate permease [Conexibacter sp.]|nr:gluconate permease [Conexibacter sp.]
MWNSHDTLLVIKLVIAIAAIVILVARYKLHPFLALTLGALGLGLAAPEGPADLLDSFKGGAGDTLGNVGIVLALGTMLGKLLAESGGADQIATTVIRHSGRERLPWAMALIALIVGIPLFFEIGVVLLVPIIFTVVRELRAEGKEVSGQTYLLLGLPALAGLSVLHGLVPPHPGPLIAIGALHADLGTTLAYGLVVAIPTVAICGPLFARFASRWATADPPQALIDQVAKEAKHENPPSFGLTLFTILLPVALMLVRTAADLAFSEGDKIRDWAEFIGDPIVALLIAVLVSLYTLGVARGFKGDQLRDFLTEGLAPAATILLIIGAGGAFKQVLIDSGIGDSIAKGVQSAGISALLLGWLVAVLIRLATGSATVAITTAAGIMAPIVAKDASVNGPLLALAIGCGSLFLSHVNDAGFWLINQYFGMTVKDTFKTWSAMETLISCVGMAGVMILSVIV